MTLVEWVKVARKQCRQWSRIFSEAAADPAAVEKFHAEKRAQWEEVVSESFDTRARKKLAEVKSKEIRGEILKALVAVPDLSRTLREKQDDFRASGDAMVRIASALNRFLSAVERLKKDFPALQEEETKEKDPEAGKSAPGAGAETKTAEEAKPDASQEKKRRKRPATLPPPIPHARSRHQPLPRSRPVRKASSPPGESEPEAVEVSDEQVLEESSIPKKKPHRRKGISIPEDEHPVARADTPDDAPDSAAQDTEHRDARKGAEDSTSEDKNAGAAPAEPERLSTKDNANEPHPADEAAVEGDVEIDSVDLTHADVLSQPVIRLTKKSKGAETGSAPKGAGSGPKQAAGSGPKAAGSAPKAAGSGPKAAGSGPKQAASSAPKAVGSGPKAAGSAPKAAGSAPKAADSDPKAASAGFQAVDRDAQHPVPEAKTTAASAAVEEAQPGPIQTTSDRRESEPERVGNRRVKTHTGEDARITLLETYVKQLRASATLTEEQILLLDHVVTVLGTALPHDRAGLVAKISDLDQLFTAAEQAEISESEQRRLKAVLQHLADAIRDELGQTWSAANPSGLELALSPLTVWDQATELPVCSLARALVENLSRWRLPSCLATLNGPAMSFSYFIEAQKGIPLTWPLPENKLEIALAGQNDAIQITALHLIAPSEELPLGQAATLGMPGGGVFFQICVPVEKSDTVVEIARKFALTEASRFIRHLSSSRG